jgi:hypothetical protein
MSRKLVLALALGATWTIAVATGMVWTMAYESRPGTPGQPPGRWPDRSSLARGRAYTAVMAAHPRCPCTRASLDELARVMSASAGRLRAYVVFFAPEDASADWWDTDLWRKAAAIPAVTPIVDRGGTLRRLFGAETSGTLAVYDASGRLQFNGGITAARGISGANAGRLSLVSLIESGRAAAITPVFGCPLRGPDPLTTSDAQRP